MPISDTWDILPDPVIEVSDETLAEIRRLYAEAFMSMVPRRSGAIAGLPCLRPPRL